MRHALRHRPPERDAWLRHMRTAVDHMVEAEDLVPADAENCSPTSPWRRIRWSTCRSHVRTPWAPRRWQCGPDRSRGRRGMPRRKAEWSWPRNGSGWRGRVDRGNVVVVHCRSAQLSGSVTPRRRTCSSEELPPSSGVRAGAWSTAYAMRRRAEIDPRRTMPITTASIPMSEATTATSPPCAHGWGCSHGQGGV